MPPPLERRNFNIGGLSRRHCLVPSVTMRMGLFIPFRALSGLPAILAAIRVGNRIALVPGKRIAWALRAPAVDIADASQLSLMNRMS
jgi:hypothetical protein